ncbi:MAG: queuosine precursor transporter [Gammaproteobacteria bacterium]|nr:queuosine precursor transporter [Gammaproteobacteria bacterium]MXX29349.1 queuosine precursor transporter [Gammaproteobacteria bacterium]MXY05947.1 queuosine precursor transporter [Gammaproteobacteria bacterium]MYE49910.1 queuosine precursor transporter [Gammaproteobacteria bacterium]MYE85657.1 queuosine precursor transporter [Gammaproteobacteria bacterium]
MAEPNFEKRRQRVYLILSGVFLGTLALLNVLGISRFLDLSFELFGINVPMVVAIGVLPYPITFLCTDLISELFGEKKARDMVWVGLLLNGWVVFLLWLGGALPGFEPMDPATGLPQTDAAGRLPVFFEVRQLAFGAVAASMIAYLAAQFCDVRLFHFWKKLTGGRHLWLRNNASTMTSQMVDTTAVILITHFYAHALPIDEAAPLAPQLLTFILSGYVFKLLVAAVDTGPVYLLVRWLRPYLGLKGTEEATA